MDSLPLPLSVNDAQAAQVDAQAAQVDAGASNEMQKSSTNLVVNTLELTS